MKKIEIKEEFLNTQKAEIKRFEDRIRDFAKDNHENWYLPIQVSNDLLLEIYCQRDTVVLIKMIYAYPEYKSGTRESKIWVFLSIEKLIDFIKEGFSSYNEKTNLHDWEIIDKKIFRYAVEHGPQYIMIKDEQSFIEEYGRKSIREVSWYIPKIDSIKDGEKTIFTIYHTRYSKKAFNSIEYREIKINNDKIVKISIFDYRWLGKMTVYASVYTTKNSKRVKTSDGCFVKTILAKTFETRKTEANKVLKKVSLKINDDNEIEII